MKNNLTTGTLENELVDVHDRESLNRFLQKTESSPAYGCFLDYFMSTGKAGLLPRAELQKRSGIERSYFYHILSGSRVPGRDKILRICIAAGFDETETRRALEAGQVSAFYSRSRRDAAIRFAIRSHLSVIDTNLLLESYKLKPFD